MTATAATPYRTRLTGWCNAKAPDASPGLLSLLRPLVEKTQRHHQAQISARLTPSLRLERRGALRCAEGELHLFRRDIAKDLQQVRRVESDVEGIPVVTHRHL